ncbi:MAG: hypothetical protein N3B16_02010 [Candidatus Aminicenantes bacterium]|nr:hypothetical protein [Candidatus Aminicenantes bacterium]
MVKKRKKNKYLRLRIICLFILFNIFILKLRAQETLIKVDVAIVPKILSRGETGQIVLRLTVPDGAIVLTEPEFIIEFKVLPPLNLPKNFFTATDLDLETEDKKGRESLKLDKIIKIPFSVALDAPPKTYILEGKVKYTLFSLKKGWCLRTASKFYGSFSTRASIIKKKPGS